MGSADWMNRNLNSRIEVCFPVYDKELCRELDHIIQLQLADNKKAVLLDENLHNNPIQSMEGEKKIAAQEAIYQFVKSSED
jgi:polyphosphate kinase